MTNKIEKLIPDTSVIISIKKIILGIKDNKELTRYKFDTSSIKTEEGHKVRWVIDDNQRHLISCYQDGKRMLRSENIYPNEVFEYVFNKSGTYVCIDVIYGARGTIGVS